MLQNNTEKETVVGFGSEWSKFNQSKLSATEAKLLFDRYFSIFPWKKINKNSVGFDMGCGSGRWAKFIAPMVKKLHCIDPSDAIFIAKEQLSTYHNCEFHNVSVGNPVLKKNSMDFGYSLGVLHHVPETQLAINDCVNILKKGSPFLIYLYYNFDNRGFVYKLIWRLTDLVRKMICRLPFALRSKVCDIVALLIYWPLARTSLVLEKIGFNNFAERLPLTSYSKLSFYTMRTDALDRFGTRLEKRFSRENIKKMMCDAGLVNILFSEKFPYWVAIGYKS